MSHIVQTKLRDREAVRAACRRLSLPEPVHGTAALFSGSATGLIIHLPEWQYPVIVDTELGTVQYDNYGGAWGEQAQLDALLQAYAVERARLEARRKGFAVQEQKLPDGSIQLFIQEGLHRQRMVPPRPHSRQEEALRQRERGRMARLPRRTNAVQKRRPVAIGAIR